MNSCWCNCCCQDGTLVQMPLCTGCSVRQAEGGKEGLKRWGNQEYIQFWIVSFRNPSFLLNRIASQSGSLLRMLSDVEFHPGQRPVVSVFGVLVFLLTFGGLIIIIMTQERETCRVSTHHLF